MGGGEGGRNSDGSNEASSSHRDSDYSRKPLRAHSPNSTLLILGLTRHGSGGVVVSIS